MTPELVKLRNENTVLRIMREIERQREDEQREIEWLKRENRRLRSPEARTP